MKILMYEVFFSYVIHSIEKLGVLSNELLDLRNTLAYYIGIPTKLVRLEQDLFEYLAAENRSEDKTSEKRKDYIRLLQLTDRLLKEAQHNYANIVDAFAAVRCDDDIRHIYKFIAFTSHVNQDISKSVKIIASINHKLLQIRQSTNPKYSPTPPYAKRQHNKLLHEFISNYINNEVLPLLKNVFSHKDYNMQALLHWEHVNTDFIEWHELDNKNSDEFNLSHSIIMKESFYALEMPINLSHHIHECFHYFLEQPSAFYDKNSNLRKFNNQCSIFRRNLQDYCLAFGYSHANPHFEYLCDLFSYNWFGKSYIVSLFYALFAEGLDSWLTNVDVSDERDFQLKGDLIYPTVYSWWVRLKVLTSMHLSKSHGDTDLWISQIDSILNWYHEHLDKLIPSIYSQSIRHTVAFEKNLKDLVLDLNAEIVRTTLFKKYKNELKINREHEHNKFITLKYSWIFKKHYDTRIEKNLTSNYPCMPTNISDIPLCFYEHEINDICNKLAKTNEANKNKTLIEKECKKVLHEKSKKPLPAGRIMRYVSRTYFSSSRAKYIFYKTPWRYIFTKWHSDTPFLELGFGKYKIDNKHAGQNLKQVVQTKCLIETLRKYQRLNINDNVDLLQVKHNDLINNYDRSDKSAYLCFGGYNFILLKEGLSGKAVQSISTNGIKLWPPEMPFPTFINTHSLIHLCSKKRKDKQVEPLSCLFQFRVTQHCKVNSFSKLINKVWCKLYKIDCSYWKLYTSGGWEDCVLLVDGLRVGDIRNIMEELYSLYEIDRLRTHLLWNANKFYKTNELFYDSGAVIKTLIRTTNKNQTDMNINNLIKLFNKNINKDAIMNVATSAGTYDISLTWRSKITISSFLLEYVRLFNTNDLLKVITDIRSQISWIKCKYETT